MPIMTTAIGVCVLILTIVSLGFETVERKCDTPFLKRIRIPGYVGILAALGIFLLGGIKERETGRYQDSLLMDISNHNSELKEAGEKLEKK